MKKVFIVLFLVAISLIADSAVNSRTVFAQHVWAYTSSGGKAYYVITEQTKYFEQTIDPERITLVVALCVVKPDGDNYETSYWYHYYRNSGKWTLAGVKIPWGISGREELSIHDSRYPAAYPIWEIGRQYADRNPRVRS